MGIDSVVNMSDDVAPYGGESAFSQLEHNIVAVYLITAGKTPDGVKIRETDFILFEIVSFRGDLSALCSSIELWVPVSHGAE